MENGLPTVIELVNDASGDTNTGLWLIISVSFYTSQQKWKSRGILLTASTNVPFQNGLNNKVFFYNQLSLGAGWLWVIYYSTTVQWWLHISRFGYLGKALYQYRELFTSQVPKGQPCQQNFPRVAVSGLLCYIFFTQVGSFHFSLLNNATLTFVCISWLTYVGISVR